MRYEQYLLENMFSKRTQNKNKETKQLLRRLRFELWSLKITPMYIYLEIDIEENTVLCWLDSVQYLKFRLDIQTKV